MSETESDHDYDIPQAACIEHSRCNQFSLDSVLRMLGEDEDAYIHSDDLLNAMVDHLDSILQQGPGSKQAVCSFQHLVTKETLEKLLQLRSKLRADNAVSRGCSASLVDEIISKLGNLVLLVLDDSGEESQPTQSESLRGQIQRDSVIAAGQLPSRWNALPSALSSECVSPASKRLIIRLLFGVLVMQPDLDSCWKLPEYSYFQKSPQRLTASSIRDVSTIALALEDIIGEYVHFDTLSGSPIISKDQLDSSFFLSLYATIRMYLRKETPHSNQVSPRPYSQTQIFAILDLVLYPVDKVPENPSMSRLAHAVCFDWGKLLPWSWEACTDQRVAGGEIVTTLTMKWLEKIDCNGPCSRHKQCAMALLYLSENVFASFIALSDSLVYGVNRLQENHNSLPALLPLLDRLCSFVLFLLCETAENSNCRLCDGLRPYALRICRSVLYLCTTLSLKTGDQARDNYLDLLLSIDKTITQRCLAELQTDRAEQFSGRVDQVFSEAKRHLTEELILPSHISLIRFALGFLTILCNVGVRGLILRENVSSFFTILYNRLIVGNHRDGYGQMLLGPLVTALMVVEKHFYPSSVFSSLTREEQLWRLCLKEPNDSLHSSLALAQYIVHVDSSYPRKWLLLLETLDHFRTIVLETLLERTGGEYHDILRLTCQTFCLAMIKLLTQPDGDSRLAKAFFIESPWTMALRKGLKEILYSPSTSTESGDMRDYLQSAIAFVGAHLLRVLSDSDGLSEALEARGIFLRPQPCESTSVKTPNTKLFLYRSRIFVVTIE